MIEFKHVTKHYGTHPALTDFSLHVPQGQIIGLLGQNGAGKSTAMNILTGCLAPSSGTVLLNDYDILTHPRQAKRMIGYLPEAAPLYDEMTVLSYLSFVCRLRETEEKSIPEHVKAIAKHTSIDHVLNRRIGNLSKGYRQRVGFAQALCGNPQMIVLDEPTVGLDPVQAVEFRELIGTLAGKHTVLFSSHILADVQSVCDRVVILHQGKLIADHMLKGSTSHSTQFRAVIAMGEGKLLPALRSMHSAEKVEVIRTNQDGYTSVIITARENAPLERELFTLLTALEAPLMRLYPVEDSLEDIFLRATMNG